MGKSGLCCLAAVCLAALPVPGQTTPIDATPPAGQPGLASQSVRILDGADDAEEHADGTVVLSSSDLELAHDDSSPPGDNQKVGIRFRGLKVPPGAVLTKAYVQFTAKDAEGGACSLTIRGDVTAGASPLRERARDISSRKLTVAAVRWVPPPWDEPRAAGPAQRTPDLSGVVREMIAAPGWAAGNGVVFVITGQGVRRAWSYDGSTRGAPRLYVEWRAPRAPAAAPGAASSQPPQAAPVPHQPPPPPPQTTSQAVNALIDNLLATGERMLELPLSMLTAFIAAAAAIPGLLILLICRKGKRPRLRRGLWISLGVLVAFLLAFIVDRKFARLRDDVRQLRSRASATAIAGLAATRPASERGSFLFDVPQAEEALSGAFGEATVLPVVHDPAIDVVQVRIRDPLAQAYLAVVDLQGPGLEIRLGTDLQTKTLTSDFAREHHCALAINGEAGRSPAANSGLGDWKGNLVYQGHAILLEDSDARPFLSFDRRNHAAYSPAAAVDTAVTQDRYNVIWGRWDAVLDGEVPPGGRDRQPRTAMGINRDGTLLFLLVVDGRQPNYSMGLTKQDTGRLLKAFGAWNGMLCDEGGSSCMYVSRLGGIVNIPCDRGAKERPTYTHFGIAAREVP